MKKLISNVLLMLLLLSVNIVVVSCNNKCKDVSCQNGGTCDKGTCSCPTGYVGIRCENKATTIISYKNTTNTKVYINANDGRSRSVEPNESGTFEGKYGDILSGLAYTYGATVSGTQVGLKVNWAVNEPFPASGVTEIELKTPSDMFFLKVQNNSSSALNKLYVNYGLASEVSEDVNIPKDGYIYGIGYYKAFSNSNVRLQSLLYSWNFNLGLSLTENQTRLVTAL